MRAVLHRALVLLTLPLLFAAAPASPTTIVLCAPGYPSSTSEAQPAMDAFASALAQRAALPAGSLRAVYDSTEADGLKSLTEQNASVAIVTLPFYTAHRAELAFKPRLSVQAKAGGVSERWTLVAKQGRLNASSDLAGMTVSSTAGYAPEFVRDRLTDWGPVPASTKVEATSQILSALRKAATSADTAVLLDGEQAASLASLPFSNQLEVVARSQPVPTALVVTVESRLPEARWSTLEKALLALSSDPKGIEALSTIRMVRFVPLDSAALAAADTRKGGRGK